jgi:hypothetical protein
MFSPPMWKAFQRYRKLDPEARKLFWRAVALLPMIAVSLRARGFQRTKEKLQRRLALGSPTPGGPARGAEVVQKTCRTVAAAARYGLGRPTCLAKSLALWHLLQKQNVATQLRIGVNKADGKFEAHAWVEHDGMALNQSEEVHEHYAAFEAEFSNLPGENA